MARWIIDNGYSKGNFKTVAGEIQKVLNPNINRNSIVGFKVFKHKLESSETISQESRDRVCHYLEKGFSVPRQHG